MLFGVLSPPGDVVLEYSAHIADKKLKGVEIIHFDEEGKIVEFEVMVRPTSAILALGEAVDARIGPLVTGAKKQV